MIDVYESEGNMFDLEYINRLTTRLSKPSPNCIATSPNLVDSHGTNGNTSSEIPKTPVETSSDKQSTIVSIAPYSQIASSCSSSNASNSSECAEGNQLSKRPRV